MVLFYKPQSDFLSSLQFARKDVKSMGAWFCLGNGGRSDSLLWSWEESTLGKISGVMLHTHENQGKTL